MSKATMVDMQPEEANAEETIENEEQEIQTNYDAEQPPDEKTTQ